MLSFITHWLVRDRFSLVCLERNPLKTIWRSLNFPKLCILIFSLSYGDPSSYRYIIWWLPAVFVLDIPLPNCSYWEPEHFLFTSSLYFPFYLMKCKCQARMVSFIKPYSAGQKLKAGLKFRMFFQWKLFQGQPKQRLKRLFRFIKWEKREDGTAPDQEYVLNSAGEDEIQDGRLVMEDLKPEADDECLVPGLPNEVIVDFILTKLPWRTLYIVSSLNHAWEGVFRTGEVHEARVRTGNAESLIVMTHAYPDPNDRIFQGVSLYDPNRDAWHLLPPLPRINGGISSKYECAIVNGKVYVIGCLTMDCAAVSCKAVLMLDLAGCRGVWNDCASMKLSRSQFACQVKNNKIYVFGGVDEQDHMLDEAHVYDPVKNSWSPVASMGHKRSSHKAVCLNESLYLYGGSFWCHTPGSDSAIDPKSVINRQGWRPKRAEDADSMEIYDSNKDEWLTVENFTKGRNPGSYFVVDESLYHLHHKGIDLYDKHLKSWQFFERESWSDIEDSEVCAAEVWKGEIFALVLKRRENGIFSRENWSLVARYNIVAVPVKASWSGTKSNNLTWQRMKCPYDFNWFSCSIHPLLL